MLRKFIVEFVGDDYDVTSSREIVLSDKDSTICGYVSWCVSRYSADLVLLYNTEEDGGGLVAMAEKKVLVTLKKHGAADITKLL